MDKSARYSEIDDLRGLSMLVMMLIHTTVFYLYDPLAFFLWNWSQFAVQIFIFCSAYIYYKNKQIDSLKGFKSYLKKRLARLLIPYYIFAPLYFVAIYIMQPAKLTGLYILKSLLLIGGIDIDWLVLLFLYLTVLIPLLGYLFNKRKIFFYLYLCFAILSSIIFIFYRWTLDYRLIMWLTWSIMPIFAIFFVKYSRSFSFYIWTGLISFIIFLSVFSIETFTHHPLNLIDNKYPPNILILSYGTGCIILFHFISKINVFSFSKLKQLLRFMSVNSYSLYFIHYTYLYFLSFINWHWKLGWLVFFCTVVTFSLITQRVLFVAGRELKLYRI